MSKINPIIFTKKIKYKSSITPLNFTSNTMGKPRYYPPTTMEWNNSIYAYNANSIKDLPVINKIVNNLIKSYFNLSLERIKNINNKKLKIPLRYRRISLKRIFTSKAEICHTSSKAIVNIFVYNEERRLLYKNLNRLLAILFPPKYINILVVKGKKRIVFNIVPSMKTKLKLIRKLKERYSILDFLQELQDYYKQFIEYQEENRTNDKKVKFINKAKRYLYDVNLIIKNCQDDLVTYKNYEKSYDWFLRKSFLIKEMKAISYYKTLLNLNKFKFENKFLSQLRSLVGKIYNKTVEFNIINLKTPFLNSDIFTQIIAIKLKHSKNKLLKVLRKSLSMIKFTIKRDFSSRVDRKSLSFKPTYIEFKETLNQLYPKSYSDEVLQENTNNTSLFVLNTLKYKNIGGVRLEAKGRLTRRFTASRSRFKVRWIGSLKNKDSSLRGLSSVMLRGYAKSNVQYSLVNSKVRNGTFGIKGWISSK